MLNPSTLTFLCLIVICLMCMMQDLASNMVWSRYGGGHRVAFHREMGLRIKNLNLQLLNRTFTEQCPITANIGGCSLTATTAAELKAEEAAGKPAG